MNGVFAKMKTYVGIQQPIIMLLFKYDCCSSIFLNDKEYSKKTSSHGITKYKLINFEE